MADASLTSLESFSVAELKEGTMVAEHQDVEETVVYGLALVEGEEAVTIQAVMGEGGQVLSLVPMESPVQ